MGRTMEPREESPSLREAGSMIVFIGCGKQKRKGTHPASKLYTGTYFQSCLAVARKIVDDKSIFILSAKHGVLGLSDRVESYELKLSDLSPFKLSRWRKSIREFVNQKITEGFRPVFVCGELYHKGLPGRKMLPKAGIGIQMRFMKQFLSQRMKGFLDVSDHLSS